MKLPPGTVRFDPNNPEHVAWRQRTERRIIAPAGMNNAKGVPQIPIHVRAGEPEYDVNAQHDPAERWDDVDKASGIPLENFVEGEPLDADDKDIEP